MNFGFGLANFLFTFFAIDYIDKKGRRWMLNRSFPNMTWTLLASGLFLLIDQESHKKLRQGLFLTFVFLFTFAYSVGEGPSAFIISSEVFPLFNREVGMSFAVFWNFLGAGLLALFTPSLAYALTKTGLLALFSGLNLVAWTACFYWVPETSKVSLERINYIFEFEMEERFRLRNILRRVYRRLISRQPNNQSIPLQSMGVQQ